MADRPDGDGCGAGHGPAAGVVRAGGEALRRRRGRVRAAAPSAQGRRGARDRLSDPVVVADRPCRLGLPGAGIRGPLVCRGRRPAPASGPRRAANGRAGRRRRGARGVAGGAVSGDAQRRAHRVGERSGGGLGQPLLGATERCARKENRPPSAAALALAEGLDPAAGADPVIDLDIYRRIVEEQGA